MECANYFCIAGFLAMDLVRLTAKFSNYTEGLSTVQIRMVKKLTAKRKLCCIF